MFAALAFERLRCRPDVSEEIDVVERERPAPKGLAFDVVDLHLMEGWALRSDLRMVLDLDHGIDDEEYEEVVSFQVRSSAARTLFIWRNADVIIVQPLVGRPQRYRSVADALEASCCKRLVTRARKCLDDAW